MDGRLVIVLIHGADLNIVNHDESTKWSLQINPSNFQSVGTKAAEPQSSGISIAHVQVHHISLGYWSADLTVPKLTSMLLRFTTWVILLWDIFSWLQTCTLRVQLHISCSLFQTHRLDPQPSGVNSRSLFHVGSHAFYYYQWILVLPFISNALVRTLNSAEHTTVSNLLRNATYPY